jgi:hypothetical protein
MRKIKGEEERGAVRLMNRVGNAGIQGERK